MLAVYVAAPREMAPRVREIHGLLDECGCKPVSHWAEVATDAQELSDRTFRAHRAAWQILDDGLRDAHVMLVMSHPTAGGELFAEVGRFLASGKPILWVGERRILSCYAPGVVRESSFDTAMKRLAMAARASGPQYYRDVLLSTYAGPHCPRCHMEGVDSRHFPDGSPAWECRHCGAMFAKLQPATTSPGGAS